MKLVKHLTFYLATVSFYIAVFFTQEALAEITIPDNLQNPMIPILLKDESKENQEKEEEEEEQIEKITTLSEKNSKLNLSAIAISDGNRCCIINEKVFCIGDKVKDYVIDNITKDKVYLIDTDQKEKVITIN